MAQSAGRTRARSREDVRIRRVLLVSMSGWWEIENFDTVVRIAREIAEDVSWEFARAVLRPHAHLIKKGVGPTEAGKAVLDAVRRAGYQLATEGAMDEETLEAISRPLIIEEDLRRMENEALRRLEATSDEG